MISLPIVFVLIAVSGIIAAPTRFVEDFYDTLGFDMNSHEDGTQFVKFGDFDNTDPLKISTLPEDDDALSNFGDGQLLANEDAIANIDEIEWPQAFASKSVIDSLDNESTPQDFNRKTGEYDINDESLYQLDVSAITGELPPERQIDASNEDLEEDFDYTGDQSPSEALKKPSSSSENKKKKKKKSKSKSKASANNFNVQNKGKALDEDDDLDALFADAQLQNQKMVEQKLNELESVHKKQVAKLKYQVQTMIELKENFNLFYEDFKDNVMQLKLLADVFSAKENMIPSLKLDMLYKMVLFASEGSVHYDNAFAASELFESALDCINVKFLQTIDAQYSGFAEKYKELTDSYQQGLQLREEFSQQEALFKVLIKDVRTYGRSSKVEVFGHLLDLLEDVLSLQCEDEGFESSSESVFGTRDKVNMVYSYVYANGYPSQEAQAIKSQISELFYDYMERMELCKAQLGSQ
ncbi:hypothetical protein MP228_006312 [Amoeboaphelidium protococcarum]|nr:hypothetical protein MP228_006312 [Amoeboaphelidium protococcarum]